MSALRCTSLHREHRSGRYRRKGHPRPRQTSPGPDSAIMCRPSRLLGRLILVAPMRAACQQSRRPGCESRPVVVNRAEPSPAPPPPSTSDADAWAAGGPIPPTARHSGGGNDSEAGAVKSAGQLVRGAPQPAPPGRQGHPDRTGCLTPPHGRSGVSFQPSLTTCACGWVHPAVDAPITAQFPGSRMVQSATSRRSGPASYRRV